MKQDLLAKGLLRPSLSLSILFICFWTDLVGMLVTNGNMSAVPGYKHVYKYMKIQGPWVQRNYIIERDQRSDLHGTSFQSSLKINHMLITRPTAYNKSLQHPTITVLLIKILIFFLPLSSVHLFQSNQCFEATEFMDQHISEKL